MGPILQMLRVTAVKGIWNIFSNL